MALDKQFNVRVYGLLIQNGHILLVDELIKNAKVTKFPGGGLKWGEGTVDCLKREWYEETGLEIWVRSHFYTTDFFQQSAFDGNEQVISIYYNVAIDDLSPLTAGSTKLDFAGRETAESFRWHPLDTLHPNVMSMPIDQVVAGMLPHDQLRNE